MNIRPALTVLLLAALASLLPAQDSSAPEIPDALDVQQLSKPPRLTRPVQPIYPYAMRLAGLDGKVLLEYVVGPDGRVVDAFVVKSNNPWFERPALDAVFQWRFAPGEKDGRKVFTRVQQVITFQLQGGGESLWGVRKQKHSDTLPEQFRWEVPPETVRSTFPTYPFGDLQQRRRGSAKLQFAVTPRGRVTAVKLLSATTPEMGFAALAAIDAWEFEPARKADGSPSWAALALEFRFDDETGDSPVTDAARGILGDLKRGHQFPTPNQLDAPLRPISRRPPVFPTSLQEQGTPGEALIEFFIDSRGDAQLPRVVSATAPEFGYAAAQAVGTWRFKPPMQGGRSTTVRAQVPIKFNVGRDAK
jgi:TonB family protein